MTQKKKELPYLERDISWMYFNRRILQEAARPHVPLLERMAFLGIYSNNLDEFFRVRMATQNRIAECTDKSTSRESEHAKKLIKQISKQNTEYTKIFEETIRQTTEDLKKENIYLISDTEVSSEQLDFIRSYYKEKLSGSIIPIWFSAIRYIIRKSKFPQNPKRSVRFSGKGTKRSVQKRKARNTQKAETKVL